MNTTGKYVKHGLTHSRVRNIWRWMMRRCYNEKYDPSRVYFARGIKVCERWHDLQTFVADMGHPPQGMSIDRIDTNGNYEPSNCRWATPKQQARNTRRNVYLELNGERKLATDWCTQLGIKFPTLCFRLKRGMSAEEALTSPIGRWAK